MNSKPTGHRNPSVSSELHLRRTEAAIASGGTSSEPIIEAALAVIREGSIEADLLEFGAGTGSLLQRLTDGGWIGQLTGADILDRPHDLNEQIKWIQGDLNLPISLPNETFDTIVSTEVIEHLENPRAVAREFARLLRPGGKLILTTPNQGSIRSLLCLLITGHFVAFQDTCYPAHITALLRKDLHRIFSEAGFQGVYFSYTDSGGIPKFPRLTWQEISFSRLRGRLFSDNLVMEARLADR